MKKTLLGTALLILVGTGWWYLAMAANIATGYSAKQLCSGVLVGNLPEAFVLEQDIHPRMATLGPALPLLRLKINQQTKTV